MKRKLILLMLILVLITSCHKHNYQLDESALKTNLASVQTKTFSLANLESLASSSYFPEAVVVGDDDLINYGLRLEDIEYDNDHYDYLMSINPETKLGYAIIKPKDEAMDEVVEALNLYFADSENVIQKSYQGYILFINATDNTAAYNLIMTAGYAPLLSDVSYLETDDALATFNLEASDVNQIVALINTNDESILRIVIVKPNNATKVTNALNNYFGLLEANYKHYLMTDYIRIANRQAINYKGYLIYVVTDNNDDVISAIKQSIIK